MFARLKEYIASKLRRVDWSDVLIRAAKTGGEVAIAAGLFTGLTNVDYALVKSALLAGGAAAVTIVWNALVQAFRRT